MAQGLLKVSGKIELKRFWPTGSSDADTVEVILDSANPFRFRTHPGAPFRPTQAFERAVVRGRFRKAPIKKGRITVRLQGVDAPELHYRAQAALKGSKATAAQKQRFKAANGEFRQPFGETATVKLVQRVKKAGQVLLPCEVYTAVDEPDEVWDTYARLVGDIVVRIKRRKVNLNQWLVRLGWAVPSFYSSMSNDEILVLTALARKARKRKAGLWRYYASPIGDLDSTLVYRRPSTRPKPARESGPVILPKLFRRLVYYDVNRRAQMLKGSFVGYLKRRAEYCYLTNEFLEFGIHSAVPHRLDEFVSADKVMLQAPDALVFKEAAARLVGPGGKPVKWW